jgi:hypothetical protein
MAISVFIIACFFLFVVLKAKSGKSRLMYPVRVDCDDIVNQVENSEKGLENFHSYAHQDSYYVDVQAEGHSRS